MKYSYQCLLLILICGFISPAFAQTPFFIGNVNDVRTTFSNKLRGAAANQISSETIVSHSIPGEPPLLLKIVSSRQHQTGVIFYGEVKDTKSGRFYLRVVNGQASGAVTILDQKKYYRYSSKADGSVYLTKEDIDKVLCVNLPKAKEATDLRGQNSQSANAITSIAALEPVPLLESLPGAISVLYLDFDGETVTNTEWNRNYTNGEPIVAEPTSYTASEMTEIWKLISEDFLPFALNVTTDVMVFNNSAPNTRMRVIFTPTQAWFPGSVGGVGYVGSFTWGGVAFRGETPCWVFNTGPKAGGETGSHEAGHTLGLNHDGRTDPPEEYFWGQDRWAPIMGVGFAQPLVQWSKGEYPNASNNEDDFNIITTLNGFGYRPDDHGNTRATATALVMDANGNISATANKGIISTRTDVDVFSFTSTGGKIAFTVNPSPDHPNLDISVTLSNAAGTVIASDDPPAEMTAAISATLTPGTYYISIDGVQGGMGANSDYASLGAYTIAPGKDYCTPVYNGGCDVFADLINNFSFNTLVNNNSGCGGNTANSYSVYAPTGTFTTTVNRGQSYPLKIQGAPDAPENFGVWIDYNQDNDFADAGEFVYATSDGSVNVFSTTITIPATAAVGPTRLRVRSNFSPITSFDYCRSTDWGEAEDYTISIVGDASVVTLSEPVDGAIFIAPATINLAATINNNDDPITKVEFFNNNTKLGEDLTAPYTFSWTGVPAGAYTLTALVTYNSGLSSISAPVSVTVQSMVTVSSIAPSNGAAGVGVVIKGDNFVNETTVRFGGVAATEVYVASSQLLYATVPAGAATGSVQVESGGHTAQNTPNFTVAPIASPWVNKAGTLTARAQYGAVAANGRIYVFGGYNSTGLLSSLEIYDPATNTWTAGAPMPGAARGMAVALGANGSIYVFSGFTVTVSTAVYRYTPSTNSWTTLASMPVGTWEAAAATAANGKIYVFGGQQTSNGNAFNPATRIYDVATDTWSVGANMPVAVKQHNAVKAADGKIYLFGGRTGANEPLDVVQIYDPVTNTWTTGAPMMIPKVQFGTVSATDGRIYIVGGKARINSNAGPFFHTVEIYDPATNTWTEGPVIPAQAGELKAVNVDGNLYAIGGTDGTFRNYNFQLASTPLAPLSPAELTATAVSATQIGLTWTDRADNETQYTVERATAADGPYTVVATLGANTQAYANSGLLPGTRYYYRVRCSNTVGNSDYSNTANATTQEVVTDSDFDIVHGNNGTLSGVTNLTVYPNPVRNTAQIDLSVSKDLQVNLTIYDHKGNVVKQLYNGKVNAGAKYQFSWSAAGKAHGAYWLQLTTATGVMTRKIVVAAAGGK